MTSSERPQRLRLMDTFRNLFYTPVYVAVAGGHLYKEGLDVMFSTVPSNRTSVSLLKDGTADIIQTGISRSFMDLDDGNHDAPLHIAEINQRDGFFLVSRKATDGWTWSDIEGASLIPVGFTPVPWMSLKAILTKHGVNINKVNLIEGLSAQEAIEKFREGGADYIHMVSPFAQQLVEEGAGHIAVALGPELGYICYSSFAVTPQYLEANADIAQKFVSGFYSAQQWVASNDAVTVAKQVEPFFPDVSKAALEQGIQRYKDQQTWATDPLIGEDGFDAMRDVLIEGGLVKGRHTYERLVRPEFARKAIDS